MGRQFKSESSLQAGTTSSLIRNLLFITLSSFRIQSWMEWWILHLSSSLANSLWFSSGWLISVQLIWRVFCSYHAFLIRGFLLKSFPASHDSNNSLQNFIRELIAEHATFVPGEVRKQALRCQYELPSGLQLWLMCVKKHRRRSWFRCAF